MRICLHSAAVIMTGPSSAIHSFNKSLRKAIVPEGDDADTEVRRNVAIRIQRAWRKKQRTTYLGSDFLWTNISIHARMKVDRTAAEEGKNEKRERWRRGIFLAARLQDGDDMHSKSDDQNIDAVRKHLETQHWLELIDGKHRYGSNLKVRDDQPTRTGKVLVRDH
ncbi:hypothetical protein A0H81_00828 [Grifola frondosa]|uniref:Uncharacterized protein n=1 Tax=Grifola frondosa TaxID=5627 RepID=A0A1C7MSN2_GRIFR|nr:hypothetical protein A0H81_00828 [Grifola frondosa]